MESNRSALLEAQVQAQRFQGPAPNASRGMGGIHEIANGLKIQASHFGDLCAGLSLQPGVNAALDVDTRRLESGWWFIANTEFGRWESKVGRSIPPQQVRHTVTAKIPAEAFKRAVVVALWLFLRVFARHQPHRLGVELCNLCHLFRGKLLPPTVSRQAEQVRHP